MEIPVEKLIGDFGSKYALATLCAKRAKQINAGAKIAIDDVGGKSDVIALKEISEQRVKMGARKPAPEAVDAIDAIAKAKPDKKAKLEAAA